MNRTASTPAREAVPRLRLRVRSVVVGALVAAGVVVAWWVLARSTRVLGWVAAAAVMAALLHPFIDALVERGLRRGVAVVSVLAITVAAVALVVWLGVGDLRAGLDSLRTAGPEVAADVEGGDSWVGDAARDFELRERVSDLLDDLPARLAGGTPAEAVRAAASRGIAVLITTVLTIFLIGHGPRLVRGALRQLPEARRATMSTRLHHAYVRTWRYVTAVVGKALVIGAALYGLARALDLPAPAVLALVVAVTSVVPKLGVAVGGIPVVLLAAGLHGGGAALAAATTVLLLQVADALVMDRVIEPRSVEVGPAISLAVLLLATSLYGIGGAAVSWVVAVLLIAIASEHLPPVPPVAEEPSVKVLP